MELLIQLVKEMLLAWRQGGRAIRLSIFTAAAFGAIAFLANLIGPVVFYDRRLVEAAAQAFAALGAIIVFLVYAYRRSIEEVHSDRRVELAEKRAQDNPDQPQAAWDLARIKLESYLNRNLRQVSSIFWLTTLVMIVGFFFIGYGIIQAFDAIDNLKPALLSTVSGLLVNFIGATFLVLYKSTMEQSKEYVSILERINAVGMSVQVLEKIDASDSQLKNTTTAELSKQLLALYQAKGKA